MKNLNKRSVSLRIGLLSIALVFSVIFCACPTPGAHMGGDRPLESLKIGDYTVPTNRFGTPAASIGGVAQGSVTITLPAGSEQVLENVTVEAVVSSGTVEYAVGTSSNPGTFSADPVVTIPNNQYLWLKVSGSGTAYYKIRVVLNVAKASFAITRHPASRDYLESETIQPLTVAVDPPSSSYTYQWFIAETFANTGGEAIEGETETSYTPDAPGTGESHFYYVEVYLNGEKVISSPAQIRVLTALPEPANVFQIGDVKYQYVRGIGGTSTMMFRDGGNAAPTMGVDVEYIDAFMAPDEIGANILRIMLQDEYEDWVAGNLQNQIQAVTDPDGKFREGHYAHNYFDIIRRANSYGAYIYASPWTAPARMKNNNRPRGYEATATLRADSWIAFANHFRDYLKWLNANGAPIYAVSLLNEPDWGGSADYEGMNWPATQVRDWLNMVGHITTQRVTNEAGVQLGDAPQYEYDPIPGFGGGRNRSHVFVMNAETMGAPTWADPITNNATANNRIDILSRHMYDYGAGFQRYTSAVGARDTAWVDKPGMGYTGKYYDDPENTPPTTSVTAGDTEYPQFANTPPGVTPAGYAGQREVWQTEFDTTPEGENAPTLVWQWGYVFDVLNLVDWSLRAQDESAFNYWYSHTWRGMVMDGDMGSVKNQISSRGRAYAHFARYVKETWRLGVTRTSGSVAVNTTNPTAQQATLFNGVIQTNMSMKISAYEDVDGNFINVVMFAPIQRDGTGGADVGLLRVDLPDYFTATSVHAWKSSGPSNYWKDELAVLSTDGKSATLTLNRGEIISLKFVK